MKLLVVTYNALMTSSANGRTMLSLLDGFSSDQIFNFCVTGIPDKEYCSAAYKVTNSDALKSLFLGKETGGAIAPASADTSNEVHNSDIYKGKKKPWKYYLREFAWKHGKWNGPQLKAWLRKQNFDCIVYMYGDGAALQNFAVFASDFLDIPIVVYSCEEYCFKNFNYINRDEKSFFFKKYYEMSKNATKKLLSTASGLICNTDQLGRLYSEFYDLPDVKTIMMASDMEFVENTSAPSLPEDVMVSYCGTLDHIRVKPLLKVAEALSKIDPCLKLDMYGRASAAAEKLIAECPYVNYHGFVPYEEVKKIIRESTLLVQALSFDPYYAKTRRFGFSAKNADSLACGTPYFLYEPEIIVELQFVREHNCAFSAATEDELIPTLKKALFDEVARKEIVENAKRTTETYFNRQRNIDTVHPMIEKAIQEHHSR